MASKKINHNPKPNDRVQSDGTEKALTSTFKDSVKAMDTSHDIANPAVVKLLVEMNEKTEKENITLKKNNDKLLEKISKLKISGATLTERIKWYNKNEIIEFIITALIGGSVATLFNVSDEVFPKNYSIVVLLLLVIFYIILKRFKKD